MTPSQLPPHNTNAERALLGALLLSRQAFFDVEDIVTADDFYTPAHQILFDAIADLVTGGHPIDLVAIVDILDRDGNLAMVGGGGELLDMQSTTPAISNADHYARIVANAAMARRMAAVGREITSIGMGNPDDIETAVDRAGRLVDGLAASQTRGDLPTIADVIGRYREVMDTPVPSVPTGFIELDEVIGGWTKGDLNIVGAPSGGGKALALDTPLATPTGWSTMGDIVVGDQVFDDQGQPTTVIAKSVVFTDHDCYEVVFDDQTVIVADGDHKWLTYDSRAWDSLRDRTLRTMSAPPDNPGLARDQSDRWVHPEVRTTRQILETLRSPSRPNTPNHRILLAGALDLPDADLPIDPYLFGCWLGDGHTTSAEITTMDAEIVAAFEADGWEMRRKDPCGNAWTYGICHPADNVHVTMHDVAAAAEVSWATVQRYLTGKTVSADSRDAIAAAIDDTGYIYDPKRGRPVGVFRQKLADAGCWNTKRIPVAYQRASYKQRLALLQGIMDTDGYTRKDAAHCGLAMSNHDLICDIRDLVLSLGVKVQPLRHKASNFATDVWTMSFVPVDPVFRLTRKLDRCRTNQSPFTRTQRRLIVDVRPIDPVPVQCIAVDSPSHLFLAGRELVPTHNTSLLIASAMAACMAGRPVLFHTLEMSEEELVHRMTSALTGIPLYRVVRRSMTTHERAARDAAINTITEWPLFIVDDPQPTWAQMKANARAVRRIYGEIGVGFFDYVQLKSPEVGEKAESRHVEVGNVSRNLKTVARITDMSWVAGVQLNNAALGRADRRGQINDIRESSAPFHDSSVAIFLYRPGFYDPVGDDRVDNETELIVRKQRNGPAPKTIRVDWMPQTAMFQGRADLDRPLQFQTFANATLPDNFQ